jgi:cytochrome c peroxidase
MALSQFLVMLVSSNSKYDLVVQGKESFTAQEKPGYEIFKGKCESCHKEPLFTDFSYRNTGMTVDRTLDDHGLVNITGIKKDDMKFKVPLLRNVAYTYPYGHDGRFFSLQQGYEHYRNKMIVTPLTDSLLQHKIPLTNL